jgi:MSHA pilin protein MshD
MTEIQNHERKIIPEEIMLARLEQSEQMREFFIELWKQNPDLAKQGGEKVKNLMMPLEPVDSGKGFPEPAAVLGSSKQRGASLIELIMFIVIISGALMGILSVMNVTTKYSADPLIHKQAIAVAESLLEEIELQDFIDQNTGSTTCPAAVTPTTRSTVYHIVACYDGYPNGGATTGISGMDGNAITSLANYTASVTIDKTTSALGTGGNTILAGSAVRITVTVTDPQNNPITIDGYRTKY